MTGCLTAIHDALALACPCPALMRPCCAPRVPFRGFQPAHHSGSGDGKGDERWGDVAYEAHRRQWLQAGSGSSPGTNPHGLVSPDRTAVRLGRRTPERRPSRPDEASNPGSDNGRDFAPPSLRPTRGRAGRARTGGDAKGRPKLQTDRLCTSRAMIGPGGDGRGPVGRRRCDL